MATIHIPMAEAARDFAAVAARVRAGAEVVIEGAGEPPIVCRTMETPPVRKLSESLRLARELGSTATLDGGFEQDLLAVIEAHPEPLDPPAWD